MVELTDTPVDLDSIVGEADAFLAALEQISAVAALRRPVLVIGERGTGKELLASRVHFLSERWNRPFVKMNCTAVHEELLESELFGHVAGAFTGAARARVGRFEFADGGTLFLDELASMSLRLQEKLLRVIEYGKFERLGDSRTIEVDVRIVGAANQDLPALARRGEFREDLLDRLSFDVVTIPPLRARPDDILLLAQKFAERMAGELEREYFPGFTAEAERQLLDYRWPGNVRELKNVVERAVYRHPHPARPVSWIPIDPFESPYRPTAPAADGPAGPQPAAALESAPPAPKPARLPDDFKQAVADYERDLLRRALADARFNQREAARRLGLTYHQLRGLLRKYPEVLEEGSA